MQKQTSYGQQSSTGLGTGTGAYGQQQSTGLGSSASYGGAAFPSSGGGRSSMSNFQGGTGAVGGAAVVKPPSFLGGSNNDDTMALKRKIAILEKENSQLKENEAKALTESMKTSSITNNDRNWMTNLGASGGAPA